VAPCAICETTMETGIRMPRIQARPPMIEGSKVIRSNTGGAMPSNIAWPAVPAAVARPRSICSKLASRAAAAGAPRDRVNYKAARFAGRSAYSAATWCSAIRGGHRRLRSLANAASSVSAGTLACSRARMPHHACPSSSASPNPPCLRIATDEACAEHAGLGAVPGAPPIPAGATGEAREALLNERSSTRSRRGRERRSSAGPRSSTAGP